MPLSEHERNVLERLEQDFPPGAPTGPSVRTGPVGRRTLVLAGAGVVVGLLLTVVALLMNSASGVLLALGAYGVITLCSAVLVDGTSRSRTALVERMQRAQSAPGPSARPWYLR